MKGKPRILLILLGLLCLAVVSAVWRSPRQETVSFQPTAGRLQVAAADFETKLPQLELERLEREPQPYPGARRDIFRFKQARRAAPVKKVAVPKKVVQPVKRPDPVVPVRQVVRELSRFTLLGFVETAAGKTVFLSSGGDIFIARTGQSFGRKQEFLVEQITDNQLVVSREGGASQIKVALVENEPLAVSSRPASVRRESEPLPQAIAGPGDAAENGMLLEQGTDHTDAVNGDGDVRKD